MVESHAVAPTLASCFTEHEKPVVARVRKPVALASDAVREPSLGSFTTANENEGARGVLRRPRASAFSFQRPLVSALLHEPVIEG